MVSSSRRVIYVVITCGKSNSADAEEHVDERELEATASVLPVAARLPHVRVGIGVDVRLGRELHALWAAPSR